MTVSAWALVYIVGVIASLPIAEWLHNHSGNCWVGIALSVVLIGLWPLAWLWLFVLALMRAAGFR